MSAERVMDRLLSRRFGAADSVKVEEIDEGFVKGFLEINFCILDSLVTQFSRDGSTSFLVESEQKPPFFVVIKSVGVDVFYGGDKMSNFFEKKNKPFLEEVKKSFECILELNGKALFHQKRINA